MVNTKSTKFILSALLAIVFLIASCAKNKDYENILGEAQVKIINAVQNSESQVFYQNDIKKSNIDIEYGIDYEYFSVVAGASSTISIKNKNSGDVKATSFAAPAVGSKYLIFYYNDQAGKGVLNGLENDINSAGSDKIKIRFLNLASKLATPINIVDNNSPQPISMAYGYASGYKTYNVGVGISFYLLDRLNAIQISTTAFAPGKNYTVWFDASSPTTPNYHVVLEN